MEKINPEILSRLDSLSQTLGVTAAHLFDVLIAQAKFEAVSIVLVLIASILGLIFCCRVFVKNMRGWVTRKTCPEDLMIVLSVGFGVGCIIDIGIQINNMSDVLGMIFNPEYWALKQIMEVLK